MDEIDNVRTKPIEANFEPFEANSNQLTDTGVIYPEKVREFRYRRADLRKIWDYLELLFFMLLDSFNKKYPVPKKTVFVITFALLYLISPIDIVPDVIPLIGFVDDVAVLAFAYSLIKDDLENYRAWKMNN
jgi:uncharacterized membrane protein YkvA (DUF1232 family)